MSCIWPQGIWHGETPQWCPALQDCKHCHCHTPAGLAVRRRRARCSACWAVWLHWHQPCRQSWSDWHHSVRKKFEVHLEHWFISTFLEHLYWNVILPRFQWFLLRSWWWYQGPGRKRSSLDPAQCSVQAQSHHRGRWLQHEQQLVPEVRQHFRIRFLLMWFELLRNHSQFYICLKPYVPDCQRMLTDRYSEETECCLQGERQYSTAPAAL